MHISLLIKYKNRDVKITVASLKLHLVKPTALIIREEIRKSGEERCCVTSESLASVAPQEQEAERVQSREETLGVYVRCWSK